MERMAALIGNLTPVFPEARDKFNVDDFIDESGAMLGTPQTIIYDADHVKQVRDARNKQAQQQQQQEAIAKGAQTAQTAANAGQVLSQTQVGSGGTALNQLLGQ